MIGLERENNSIDARLLGVDLPVANGRRALTGTGAAPILARQYRWVLAWGAEFHAGCVIPPGLAHILEPGHIRPFQPFDDLRSRCRDVMLLIRVHRDFKQLKLRIGRSGRSLGADELEPLRTCRERPEALRGIAPMPLEKQRAIGPIGRRGLSGQERPEAHAIELDVISLRDAARFEHRRRDVDVGGNAVDGSPRLQFARPPQEARNADPAVVNAFLCGSRMPLV